MAFFSRRNILIFGFLFILILTIPVTMYFLQKQQQSRINATPATTLRFTSNGTTVNQSTPIQKNINDTFNLDIVMFPSQTNEIIAATLELKFEATKLATSGAGIVTNSDAFPVTVGSVVYSSGSIILTMQRSPGTPSGVTTETKIATVTFQALSSTGTTPTLITFGTQTTLTSIADPETNVLSTSTPGAVTIGGSTITPSPTPLTTTITPTRSANPPPVCTALTANRTASGTAPLSITFTGSATSSAGTITKATFNFGDGTTQDINQGTGIGTNTVSVQATHNYNTPGTFTSTVIFTDNLGIISLVGPCSQIVTVLNAPTQAPSATVVPIVNPGPGDTLIKAGALGTVLTVIGAVLFFAL